MTRCRAKREREKTAEANQLEKCEHFLRATAKKEKHNTAFQEISSYSHRAPCHASFSDDKESKDRPEDSRSSLTKDAASFLSSSSSALSAGFTASNGAGSAAPLSFFSTGYSSSSSSEDFSLTLNSPCLPSLVKPASKEWKLNTLRRGVSLEKTVNSKTAGKKEDKEEKREVESDSNDEKEGDSMTLGDLLGFSLTQKSKENTPTTANVAMKRKRMDTTSDVGSDVISCSSFPFSVPLLPFSSPTAFCPGRFSSRSETNATMNDTSFSAANHVGSSPNGCHITVKKIETEKIEENARVENENKREKKGVMATVARRMTKTCGSSPSLSFPVSAHTSKVLVQTQLDFGQKDATRLGVWCPHCQLLYSPHQEEDTKLHRRVCSFAKSEGQRKKRQVHKNGEKRSVRSEAAFCVGSSHEGTTAEKNVDYSTSCASNSPTGGSVLSSAFDPDTAMTEASSHAYPPSSNEYDAIGEEHHSIHRPHCSSSLSVRNGSSRPLFHSRAVSEAAERAAAALLSLVFRSAPPTASIPFGSASASFGFQPAERKLSPFHSSSSSSSDFFFSVRLERQEVLLDPHPTSSFSSPLLVFLISVRYCGWRVMWEKAPELAGALEDLLTVKNGAVCPFSSFFCSTPTTRGTIRVDRNDNRQDSVQKKRYLRRSRTVANKAAEECQDWYAQVNSKLEREKVKEEPETGKNHEEESVLVCGVAMREGSAMRDHFSSSAFDAPNSSCSLFSSAFPATRATSNNASNRSSTTMTTCSNILDGDGERSLPILFCAVFGKAHTREQEPQFEKDPATQKCVLRRQCTQADVEHLWILPLPCWPPSPALPSLPSFDFIISPSNFVPRPKEERKKEDERERMRAFLLVIRCWCQHVIYGASLCYRSQLSYAAHLFCNTPKPLALYQEETNVESFLRTWWSEEESKKNVLRCAKRCCIDDTEKELDDWMPFVHNDDSDGVVAED